MFCILPGFKPCVKIQPAGSNKKEQTIMACSLPGEIEQLHPNLEHVPGDVVQVVPLLELRHRRAIFLVEHGTLILR
jgi:hypothetical protein